MGAPDDADLYDRYLDAALEGRAEDPEVFLARHPGAAPALRERIEALHRAAAPAAPAAARAAPRAEGDLPFERLGDFRLLRRLDEGGMGTVYLAEQVSLGRTVALKVVRADLMDSPTAAERFRREALAVAKLRHRSVVAVHAVGEDQGVRYLAMEYVPGRGLDEMLAEAASAGRPLAVADVARWGAALARGLAAAHAEGIVHRDVKPSNVRITPEGEPRLLDFGIARDTAAPDLTMTGPFVGSPAYAAPEQITAETGAIDGRTDVYALGMTLYECLAGRAPWQDATVEQVFRRVLTEDPPRLRLANPGVPKDLEVVVAKAIEKEPARRYATAAELADDLEAVLAFRPIRARPPGRVARVLKWAKRRPGPAAAAASALIGAIVLAGVLTAREAQQAAGVRSEARAAVVRARTSLDDYRKRRAASAEVESKMDGLHELLSSHFLSPEQDRVLDEKEDEVAQFRRDRESVFYEIIELLERAERLDPRAPGIAETRAELWREKWLEATDARDPILAATYRERVRASDPGGGVYAATGGDGRFTLTTEPPGAEVILFRYREHAEVVAGGGHRLVPVLLRATFQEPPYGVSPGTVALEVTQPSGGLARGDLVVALDGRPIADLAPAEARAVAARGGATGSVRRDTGMWERVLPAGLAVRVTAAPLLPSTPRRGPPDTTPLAAGRLEPGAYVALVRKPGFEDARVVFAVKRNEEAKRALRLFPDGTTPAGFVRIPFSYTHEPLDVWMQEREVTAGEYLAFVNDPRTLAEIDASKLPIRYPRGFGAAAPRGEDGRFRLPKDWQPDWPALGVSLLDARAYARWATERARAEGRAIELSLPTFEEWLSAGLGAGDRFYVFGNRWRPKWAKSCYAKEQANPEPVLSYPIDESVYGVFDLTGSAHEWCDSWYDEARGLRRLAGGAWGEANPEIFKVWGGTGLPENVAGGQTGFRLVIRSIPGAK